MVARHAQHRVVALELRELVEDALQRHAPAVGDGVGRERPVGAGVAAHEAVQRTWHGLDEHVGQPGRRHGAGRVAVAARVLGGDQALLPGDAHADGTARADELRRRLRVDLLRRQVAEPPQQVGQCLGAVAVRPADRLDDLCLGLRVEQVADLLLAQQLPQHAAVERQRLGATLARGRVGLVHVLRDVVEEERRGERRAVRRLHLDQPDLAALQRAQQLDEARHVEHVLQHLAVRLEHHGEGAEALGRGEQGLRLEPLLPERRPLPGPAARDEQRAGGVLAEARGVEGGVAELADDQVLDGVGIERDGVAGRRVVGVGQVQDDAVVRPQGLRVDAVLRRAGSR